MNNISDTCIFGGIFAYMGVFLHRNPPPCMQDGGKKEVSRPLAKESS
jgi:hypothetical protein